MVDPYLPRTLKPKLQHAGFEVVCQGVIPVLNTEYDSSTYSHGLIGLVGAFVTGRQGITQEDVEAWTDDLRRLGDEGSYFFSLNRYFFLARKPEHV